MFKVSVIVCTYNGEAYLLEQLNSLLAQDRKPDEIVVVDDCSLDCSWQIICAFRDSHPDIDIRTSRNERNLGFVENFSRAALMSRFDIVIFSDQDDIWVDTKVSSVYNRFSEDYSITCFHSNAYVTNAALVDTGRDLFSSLKIDKREMALMESGRYFEVLSRRNVVTGATMAVRRDSLVDSLPIPKGWIHDEWIPLVNSLKGKVFFDSNCLIKYRIHDRNTIGLGSSGSTFKRWISRASVLPFYETRIDKLTQLRDLGIAGGDERSYLDELISHLEFRLAIVRLSRWRRIFPIINCMLDGGYTRFGRGWLSAIRDFCSG
ncbi:glycosyltransferase [Pseudomonas syringae]|uniref:glycosyltransferase n=1 Tax=Pseudomonas viridiflava TaxID=33069 RepID=UPI000F030411|nr:glycosyltransferase [Pseudomonas viridiflava]